MSDTTAVSSTGKRILNMTYIAMFAALMAVCAWIAVPIATIPITLQTFGVFCAVGLLGGKRGTLAILVYILLGAIGVPVYSGGRGGFSELAGPTGGFIVGFLIAAWLIAWLKGDNPSPSRALVLTFIGIPIIDLLGAAWYAVYTQIPLTTALLTAALPFLPGDIIKAVGAVLVYLPLRKALRQFSK